MRPTIASLATAFLVSLSSFSSSPASAQCPAHDAFEPNDTCDQAASIGPGVHGGLTFRENNQDFFKFSIPAGMAFQVRLQTPASGPTFWGILTLLLDDGTLNPCANTANSLTSASFFGDGTAVGGGVLAYSTPQGSGQSYVLEIGAAVKGCFDYELAISFFTDPCANLAQDAFEDNDSCQNPTALNSGSFPGLTVSLHDSDYYSVSLLPSELLNVALANITAQENLLVIAWESPATCGDLNQFVGITGNSFGSTAGMNLFNPGPVTKTFVIQVRADVVQGVNANFCASYDLALAKQLNPCSVIPGDIFEPNSVCASAPPLGASASGLSIHAWFDADWYSIDVPAKSTLRLLSASHVPTTPRVMTLYKGCGPSNQDFLATTHNVYFSSLDPRQYLHWSNSQAFGVNTRLSVHAPFQSSNPSNFCDIYDLDFELTLGTPFCFAFQNSSGEAARMSASGSTTVGQGVLQLSAQEVPAGVNGLIAMSLDGSGAIPFGDSVLCLKSPIIRLPVASSVGGVLDTTIDWTGTAAAIHPGQTWFFQTWYRDPAAGLSGFGVSEGLRIEF